MMMLFFWAFDMIFDFWPFIIVNAIKGRRNMLRDMVLMWAFWAVVRVILFFSPEPLGSIIIPEPLNTILFFVAGAVLLVLYFFFKTWKENRLKSKILGVSSVKELLDVSPAEFEDMVVALYNAAGHKAKRTGKSGDHGVDVIVKAKNGEDWIVQCKRWRKPVGEPVIREFYGTLQHEKAHAGAIFALSGFSQPAKEWAKGKPIHLYSGEDFLKQWHRIEKQQAKNKPDKKD